MEGNTKLSELPGNYEMQNFSLNFLLLNVAVFPLFFYLASTGLPPKSVVDTLLALAVNFIWSPAKKQMISKQFFLSRQMQRRMGYFAFPI